MSESNRIQLKNCRLSWPDLFETAKYKGNDTGKYSATFLIPKKDKKLKAKIDAEIERVRREAKFKKLKEDKICIKDGDDEEYEDYDGYAGHWIIKASNTKRPTTLDRMKDVVTKDDDLFYAGCYVDGIIAFWAQDNDYGKRINANLYGVRFLKDGDAFGPGSVDVTDEFDDLDDDDYEDDDDDM